MKTMAETSPEQRQRTRDAYDLGRGIGLALLAIMIGRDPEELDAELTGARLAASPIAADLDELNDQARCALPDSD